ncbi:MAG: ribonuclease Y [Eubacteriales bacterium]|nr:ribonuclease Y [Eubacteriales bacterium]MDY5630653.1 ribonuclease Y [Eubacteriales bacterium]MDY6136376.1 ribonuclease Y [Eubacteriales bacterium]
MTSITTQLLAVLSGGAIAGITAVIALAVGLAAGAFGYWKYYEKKVGTAKSEADKVKAEAAKIIEDAKVEAKTARKEALLEAKEEEHRLRAEIDKEAKERKAEYQKTEQRLQSKESYLDKKDDALDKKQEQLEVQRKQLQSKEEELQNIEDKLKNSQFLLEKELERISGMTRDEAKQQLMDALIDSAKKDAVQTAKQIEAEAKENAEKKAQNIISLAIQRCAADHTTDTTVSVVALPNDEMKGRIIGRVGRNIRALESATGVDLIIDDTPDVVTLSGFDPVRREIARITLEKLIQDGRIHPARIEEMVDKVKKEVDGLIKEAGENAVFECGIYGIHPELIKILGKLKYRTSYGQNVLQHSLEVAFLAGVMASELGADVKVAKRAGLLHDIGKAVDHEIEGTHVQIGVDLLKKYKESAAVIHAVAAHHGDIEATSVEAVLVQAADAISSARPGARRESLENYVKRIEKLETIANSFNGVEQSYAIQAGREIRVMVKPEVVDDTTTVFLAKEIANKLEAELEYPGQIKVTVVREIRSVDYAK